MAAKPRDSCVLPMHGCWSGSLNSLQAKRSKRLRILYPVSDDSMSIDHETENFSFKKKIWRASDRRRRQKLPSRPCRGAPLLCRRTASCLLPLQRRSRTTPLAVTAVLTERDPSPERLRRGTAASSIDRRQLLFLARSRRRVWLVGSRCSRSDRRGGPRSGMERRPGQAGPFRSRALAP